MSLMMDNRSFEWVCLKTLNDINLLISDVNRIENIGA